MDDNTRQASPDRATLPGTAETLEETAGLSPRKLESRRKLLAAARKLFVERGYHDTRPQDISKEAGVGHGTFYLHFADKLACFLAFCDEACAELEVVLERHLKNATTVEQTVHEILLATSEYSNANPGVLAAATTDLSVIASDTLPEQLPVIRWGKQWAELLSAWQAQGVVVDDIDPELLGHLVIGAIRESGSFAAHAGMAPDVARASLERFLVRALKA